MASNVSVLGVPGLNLVDSNATQYGLRGEMPPEIALQEQALNRRQQIANLLIQRGMQPPGGQMVGGWYVPASPVQGFANLAQAMAGIYGTHKNDEARADLSKQSNQTVVDALEAYRKRTTEGTPQEQTIQGPGAPVMTPTGESVMAGINQGNIPGESPAGVEFTERQAPMYAEGPQPTGTVMQPPNAQGNRQALIELMANQHPRVAAIGQMLAQQEAAKAEKAEDRAFKHEENVLSQTAAMDREKARIDQMLMMKVITDAQANQMKKDLQTSHDSTLKEIAKIGAAGKTDSAAIKAGAGADKPMPASALRMQQEELDAIGTASSINADMKAIEDQVTSGKLKLGMVENVIGSAKNFLGASDESSRNLQTFKATMERLRNDSLRLNKGVQTDGDAQRAWNELMTNINDPEVVKQRLAEIQKINERAVNIRRMNVDVIRQNYGKEPMETTGYQTQPAAVGAGKGPTAGTVQDGYRFKGGDPGKPESWEKVQ